MAPVIHGAGFEVSMSAVLQCKTKRQKLGTIQVSRYCLLALQSDADQGKAPPLETTCVGGRVCLTGESRSREAPSLHPHRFTPILVAYILGLVAAAWLTGWLTGRPDICLTLRCAEQVGGHRHARSRWITDNTQRQTVLCQVVFCG